MGAWMGWPGLAVWPQVLQCLVVLLMDLLWLARPLWFSRKASAMWVGATADWLQHPVAL